MIAFWRGRYRGVSPTLIAGLGILIFAFHLVYIVHHDAYLQGPVWLFPLGLTLMSVLTIGLIYGAYWLVKSEFNAEQGFRVTNWCFAGLIGALALTFWPIFYQRIVGVTIENPLFILLVSAGVGANAGVVSGVSQVRSQKQFERVQDARDSLTFLNRLLRHNVLNAVNIIHGNAELLIDDSQSGETMRRARTIRNQSDQINDLIQNTRVLIQQLEGYVEKQPIDFSTIVADELELARETYPEATITSKLASEVEVEADPLVSAVVENLITNAIDHNDDTPTVEVTLETQEEVTVLQVADDGPGISDPRDVVTDPGEHGDNGIGLYLVQTLVSRYDGEMQISVDGAQGTTVRIELPLWEGPS